jgi:hypothetical protein
MNCRPNLILLGLTLSTAAFAGLGLRDSDDPDAQQREEEAIRLPASPQEGNLREFYVSATTAHKFYIDAATLGVGKDGVVRYVLVVRTSGGATNTTYEGIRCESGEYKIYATGHRDGTWMPTRKGEWRSIVNKPTNRHHAALSRDYFCPGRGTILTPAEGREALRLGKHPNAN